MLTKALILSVVLCESAGNPLAISNKEARGLMQLTDIGVKEVQIQYDLPAPDDIFNPEVNVLFGTLLLQHYYRETGSIS